MNDQEHCWNCDESVFPEASARGQTWCCSTCETAYVTCQLTDGTFAWEYTQESFEAEIRRP